MDRGEPQTPGRDMRSLRAQIDEDDDVIELGVVDQDVGVGVAHFLEAETDSDRPGPGKGRGSGEPACRSPDDPD